jgi:CRISPR-associated endonuclease/helicase Cas3
VQDWAERVPLPDGPFLALVEDVTGGGKTEAALVLTHRLLAEGRAKGLYMALPTMATANAMFTRLAEAYRRLFEPDPDQEPSLALAHGATKLHDGFQAAIRAGDPARASEPETDDDNPRGDEAGAACAAWLALEQRKAFLADVGVGTIDQAILGVLPAKYQSLRLLGLSQRVLIVDEAHAYDAYVGEELDRLLTFQAALGSSAVILSATLPATTKRRLVNAFRRGLGLGPVMLEQEEYPLVTLVGRVGPIEERGQDRRDGDGGRGHWSNR